MPVFAGPLWRDGDATESWVRVEKARIVEEGEGRRPGATAAVLLDGVYDYHTHIGDAFLRGRRLPHSLDRLVRPPLGLKHRMLAKTKPTEIVAGIRRALAEYAEAGTRAILDFREQGLAGLRLVEQAQRGREAHEPIVHLLGRPATGSDGELDQLLAKAKGLAMSSYRDLDPELLDRVAKASHRAKRVFAIHASESRREPIEKVLALKPDLLVHLVKATQKDLRKVQDAGVPVAVCPSSNAFFRLRPPLEAMHRAGIPFHFGTDNAMLGNRQLVHEAARAHALAPRIPDEVLLQALTRPMGKVIKRLGGVGDEASGTGRRVLILGQRSGRVRWSQAPRVVAR